MTIGGENQLLEFVVIGVYIMSFAFGWLIGQQR